MSDLRSKLIRLAHQNPELRPHVLPFLKAGNWNVVRRAEGIDSRMDALRERKFRDLLNDFAKDLGVLGLLVDQRKSWIDVVEEEGFVMELACTLDPQNTLETENDVVQLFIDNFKMGVGVRQRGNTFIISVG